MREEVFFAGFIREGLSTLILRLPSGCDPVRCRKPKSTNMSTHGRNRKKVFTVGFVERNGLTLNRSVSLCLIELSIGSACNNKPQNIGLLSV